MTNNIFKSKTTFIIITGIQHAKECLEAAYEHGFRYISFKTAEECPYDVFFAEYLETAQKRERLAFRFSPEHVRDKFGWSGENFYKAEYPITQIYDWCDLFPDNQDIDESFLTLI